MVFVPGERVAENSADTLSAHAGNVIVIAAEQHGPRGCAHDGRVELGKQYPFGGEHIDIRSLDVTAEAAKVGITEIIGDDQQNVGPLIGDGGLTTGNAGIGCKQREQYDNGCSEIYQVGHPGIFYLFISISHAQRGKIRMVLDVVKIWNGGSLTQIILLNSVVCLNQW